MGGVRGIDAYFLNASLGWSWNGSGTLWRTQDGGSTWARANSPPLPGLVGLNFSNDHDGWVTGTDGSALHSSDGGTTWVATPIPAGVSPRSMNATGACTLAVDSSGRALSRDGGVTWRDASGLYGARGPNGWLMYQLASTGRVEVLGCSPVSGVLRDFSWVSTWIDGDTVLRLRGFEGTYTLGRSLDRGESWGEGAGAIYGYPNIAWAGANGSKALVELPDQLQRTEDAGATWTPLGAGLVLNDGVVLRIQGTLLARSTDLGKTWSTQPLPLSGSGLAMRMAGPGAVVLEADAVSGAERPARWSLDGGRTWRALALPQSSPDGPSRVATWMLSATAGWQATSAGELLRTADGGATWTRAHTGLAPGGALATPKLLFTDSASGWLLSADKGLYRTTDAGTSWQRVRGPQGDLSAADFEAVGASRVWVRLTGSTPSFLISTDAGASWSALPTPADATALSWVPAGGLLAYGKQGSIAFSSDNGAHWTLRYSGTLKQLNRLRFATASLAYAVGADGVVLRSKDGGASWGLVRTGGATLRDVGFAGTSHVWAVGDGGSILASRDGGDNWLSQTLLSPAELSRVQALNTDQVWITGEGGFVLVTRTGGR